VGQASAFFLIAIGVNGVDDAIFGAKSVQARVPAPLNGDIERGGGTLIG
jgi:hypothetical protein